MNSDPRSNFDINEMVHYHVEFDITFCYPKSWEYNGEKSHALAFDFLRIPEIYTRSISWQFVSCLQGRKNRGGSGGSCPPPQLRNQVGAALPLYLPRLTEL